MYAISIALGPTQLVHVKTKETAKEAWDVLKKVHQKGGHAAFYANFTRLIGMQYKEGDDLEEHIASMVNLYSELADIGEEMKDKHFAVIILKSLPASWDSVAFLIEAMIKASETDKPLTSEYVISMLTDENIRRHDQADFSSNSKRKNLAALHAGSNGKPDWVAKAKCFKCGKQGHLKTNCPQKKNGGSQANSAQSTQEVFSLGVYTTNLAFKSALTNVWRWILDSGAARHFTGERDQLVDFVAEPLKVTIANENVITCPGYGKMTLTLESGKKLELSGVYHLPGATASLVSVGMLIEKGCTVTFRTDKVATVTLGKKTLFSTVPDTTFFLPVSQTGSSTSSPLPVLAGSSRESGGVSLMTAHRNFGHSGLDSLIELDRQDAARGFRLTDKIKEDCESCMLEKSKRAPFKTVTTPVTRPFERVFVDLGFVDVEDHEGRKVYFAIVDQFSTAKWVFVMKTKNADEVCAIWTKWRKNVETTYGYKIRHVRSDNGSEWVSKKFVNLLEDVGTTHECTAPYTPEQNGQVERMNGSLLTRTRTVLKASGLNKKWWSAAIVYVCYTSNRLPHPRIKGMTPYEMLQQKKPMVGHLKPFGTTAFVHVDKSLRCKLDDTAIKGILIGYDNDQNYKIYVPELDCVVVSRNVNFSETIPSRPTVQLPEDEPVHKPAAPPSKEKEVPIPTPVVEGPPDDGWEYATYKTGRNPGRLEEINEDNIIDVPRRRVPVQYGSMAQEGPVYVMLSHVQDDDATETEIGTWEEKRLLVGVAAPDVPRTFAEAMADVDREHWKDAVAAEYDAFEAHGVLKLAKLPPGARALGTTWVFAKKTDEHGKVLRYKARLVAQGFAQRPGVDFNETFAPVARMSTIRSLFALAASERLEIESFDFDTAFLNGKMTEDVYIKVPPGYPGKFAPGDVLKLVGAMYGTKQAPREWNVAVHKLMMSLGYGQAQSDSCVYVKVVGKKRIVVVLYVDDGLILCSDKTLIASELEAINKAYKIKRLGRVSTFLSIQVVHSDGGIFIHQKKYVTSICERFLTTGGPLRSSAATPMESSTNKDASSPLYEDVAQYQSAVGALQYAAQLTRPDIAAAVRALAQAVAAPTLEDWIAAKRLFRYLSQTTDFGIMFAFDASMEIVAYSDASWADDQENRRSVGAFAMLLAGGAVSWRSKQQSLIATSTTESEMIALSDATKEVLSFRALMRDLGVTQPSSTRIFEDNSACIAIAQNPSHYGRTKHFSVITLFVRERIAFGDVHLEYCPTADMTADVLTKGLAKTAFERHRAGLGMVSLAASVGGSIRDSGRRT